MDISQQTLQFILGHYVWLGMVMFIGILLRKYIESAIDGVMVFFGSDINEEDIIFLNGRMGRITKHGLFKTKIYLPDTEAMLVIPNSKLRTMLLEKHLPNGSFADLRKNLHKDDR
jgi:hypothetical protein